MICHICASPAHHVYAEGDLLLAFCSVCDRAGAEDAPMESGRSVYLGGVALLVLILVAAILGGIL